MMIGWCYLGCLLYGVDVRLVSGQVLVYWWGGDVGGRSIGCICHGFVIFG